MNAGNSIRVLFPLYVLASLCLLKLGSPIPARVLLELVAFGLLLRHVLRILPAFVEHNPFLQVNLVFGVIGLVATLAHGDSLKEVLLFEFKWIVQPLFHMLIAYLCCYLAGIRFTVRTFYAVLSLSSLFAVMQMLDIQFAWDALDWVDEFQGIDKQAQLAELMASGGGNAYMEIRARGFSWSPVHLGYQACLAFGLFYASLHFREFSVSDRPLIGYAIVGLWILALIGSGTRSALLGIGVLMLLHFSLLSPRRYLYLMLLPPFLIAAAALFPLLQQAYELRVLETNDSSAVNRLPLLIYGWNMFLDNMIGYGWVADSTAYADRYWYLVMDYQRGSAIMERELHNFYMNILHVYGLAGGLALVYFFYRLLTQYGGLLLLVLLPYLLHALFHNDGIFHGDNYIWIVLGIVKYHYDLRAAETLEASAGEPDAQPA
jgi:hypothetical protein